LTGKRSKKITRKISFDTDLLNSLEWDLDNEISGLTPGEQRIVRDGKSTIKVPKQNELNKVSSEIIENYRNGIEIATQTETLPLIPLFEAKEIELPPELAVVHEHQKYNYYFVETNFSILLPKDQFPSSAEFGLTLFDDNTNPARRSRPIQLFPQYKDVNLFSIDIEGGLGIDAGLQISIPMKETDIIPYADLKSDASVKAKFVVGPLKYNFRKAVLEVKGIGSQNILWRYNISSELKGTNDFKSILLLKVAEETEKVQMAASLGVIPCKRKWRVIEKVLPKLSDSMILSVEL